MNQEKLDFIAKKTIPLLKNLPAGAVGKWGKMNGQQMVEHMSGFFKVSSGKLDFAVVTPAEHLPKYKEFLLSDKEFRENTKAPLDVVPEEPVATRLASMAEAVAELENEINDFMLYFENDAERKTGHPVFGELNFEEWVLLHYKHVQHHLKQFSLI